MKNNKKFFSLVLVLGMLLSTLTFNVSAEETSQDASYQDIPFIPVEMNYDTDIIGKLGETAGDDWAKTYFSKKNGLDASSGTQLDKAVSENNILKVHKNGYTPAAGGDSGNFDPNGTYYQYRINRAGFSAGVNDSVSVLNSQEKSFKTSERPVSKIAVMRFVPENSGAPEVTWTVNYKDGTSEKTAKRYSWCGSPSLDGETIVGWYGYKVDENGNNTNIDWIRSNKYLIPDDENKLVYNTSNPGSMIPLVIQYISVDETKTVESISVKSAGNDKGNIYLLAITEIPMATADLQSKISEVGELSVDEVTRANADSVFLANRYADEMVLRQLATENEFTHLRELKAQALWYMNYKEPVGYKVDISDKMNVDLIGMEGDTVTDPEAFGSLLANNQLYYHDYRGATEGFVYDSETDTGVYSVYERTPGGQYWTNAYETASDKTAPIYMEGLKTNVPDAFRMTPDLNGAVIALNQRPSKELKIAMASESSTVASVTVNYSDGTTSSVIMDVNHTSSLASPTVTDNEARCGWFSFAGNPNNPTTDRGYHLILNENNTLEKSNVTKDGRKTERSAEYGIIGLYTVPVDSSKIPVSVKLNLVEGGAMNAICVWGITEIPVSSEEIEAYLNAYEAKTIKFVNTEEESEEAKKMMWYANELEARNYKYASKYETVVKRYNQAIAQDEKYVDLSDKADADLFVSIGDKAVGTPVRETFLYDGSKIAETGIIKMLAPLDADFESPLTGTTFKLSGDFNKSGNDSVYMAKASSEDISFKLSEIQLERVAFIVGADIASEASDYITAYLTYEDGTKEETQVTVYGPNTTVGIQKNAFLQISSVVNYDIETNTYVSGGADNLAAMKVVPACVNATPTKKVASLSFKSAKDFSYSIIAVTEVPYTNEELYATCGKLMKSYYPVSKITKDNAADVLELCALGNEAYARNCLSATEFELVTSCYNAAIKSLDSKISFETSITTNDEYATATVTMTNTTAASQTYQIIIAAYEPQTNRLLGINFGVQKTLETEQENITDSVTLPLVSGAVYKAFVWSGFGDMIPLAY